MDKTGTSVTRAEGLTFAVIGQIGDLDPLNNGGLVLRRTDNGKLIYELEYVVCDNDDESDDGARRYTLYRHTIEDDVLDDLGWVKVRDVCASIGADRIEFRRLARDPDPVVRAGVYLDVAEHYGWDELDLDPLRNLTQGELHDRWPDYVDAYEADED